MLLSACLSVFQSRNNWGELLIACVDALPLAMVAGLRSLTIGTDLLVYGDFNFRMAQMYQSLGMYYKYIKNINNTEYGYAALNFIVSRFTNNLNTFLFVLSLFTLVPFFIGALKMEKIFKVPVFIQAFLYFTIFFGLSLNEMRQILAVSWVFLSISVLFQDGNHKWLKSVLLWIIAFNFHRTAIIGLLIMGIYYFFIASNLSKWNAVKQAVIFLASFGLLVVSMIMLKSGNLPTFFAKYSQYIDGTNSFGSKVMGPFRTFSMIIFPMISMIIIFVLRGKKKVVFPKMDKTIESSSVLMFFTVMLFFDVLLMFGGIKSAILPRMGQYFGIFETFLIPFSINIAIRKKGRWIPYIVVIFYYLIIFIYITHSGENQIYPYQWVLGNTY